MSPNARGTNAPYIPSAGVGSVGVQGGTCWVGIDNVKVLC